MTDLRTFVGRYCSDHSRFLIYVQPSSPRASVKPLAPISINRRRHSSGSAPVTLERVPSERPSVNLGLSSIWRNKVFLRLSRELALRFWYQWNIIFPTIDSTDPTITPRNPISAAQN